MPRTGPPRRVDDLRAAAHIVARWAAAGCRGPAPLLSTDTGLLVKTRKAVGGFNLYLHSPRCSVCATVRSSQNVTEAIAKIAAAGHIMESPSLLLPRH